MKLRKKKDDVKLVMLTDSTNLVAEQFRKLRTNLQLAAGQKPLQTIAITSAISQEGKTMCAANLALSFVQHNEKVLLVDLNIQKPALHQPFRVENKRGLADVLLQGVDVTSVIQELPINQLYLLPGGQTPLLHQERISAQKLDELFTELKQQFDVIIIDTAPILSLSTTALIANRSDAVLIVSSKGNVTRQQLLEASATLERAQANVVGVVVNHYELTKQQQKDYGAR